MGRLALPALALGLLFGLFSLPLSAGDSATSSDEEWLAVPFRVRDLTFPTVLVMGFEPRLVGPIQEGNWAIEVNTSVSNNFQVSSDIEDYLEARGGPRRPLTEEDFAAFELLDGDQFYIDGEFDLVGLGVHYALSEQWVASLHLSYLRYGGGFLDGTIYGFHDAFGLRQAGRQYVLDDQYQLFYKDDGGSFSLASELTSGGLTDPVISFSYNFPQTWRKWSLGVEAGLKIPLADEAALLGTGSYDFGFQWTVQRRWRKRALVVNLAYVLPGEFQPDGEFEPPSLPSLNLTYIQRVGRRWTGLVQLFFSDSIFRDATKSSLSELEFQLTAGFKLETEKGLWGFGLTENLFNFDNTPDIAVHLSYARLLP